MSSVLPIFFQPGDVTFSLFQMIRKRFFERGGTGFLRQLRQRFYELIFRAVNVLQFVFEKIGETIHCHIRLRVKIR